MAHLSHSLTVCCIPLAFPSWHSHLYLMSCSRLLLAVQCFLSLFLNSDSFCEISIVIPGFGKFRNLLFPSVVARLPFGQLFRKSGTTNSDYFRLLSVLDFSSGLCACSYWSAGFCLHCITVGRTSKSLSEGEKKPIFLLGAILAFFQRWCPSLCVWNVRKFKSGHCV